MEASGRSKRHAVAVALRLAKPRGWKGCRETRASLDPLVNGHGEGPLHRPADGHAGERAGRGRIEVNVNPAADVDAPVRPGAPPDREIQVVGKPRKARLRRPRETQVQRALLVGKHQFAPGVAQGDKAGLLDG